MMSCDSNMAAVVSTLVEQAHAGTDFVVCTSDSRGSAQLSAFAANFPERFVDVGIAEQILVGMAAGMAADGRSVVIVAPAAFVTSRAFEQIKIDFGAAGLPAVIVGVGAGLSYGIAGFTHHAIDDFAILRSVPGIVLCAPSCPLETKALLSHCLRLRRLSYIRIGKAQEFHPSATSCTSPVLGRARKCGFGDAVGVIGVGEIANEALLACDDVRCTGIDTTVLTYHTLSPFDMTALIDVARRTRAILTVEEHRRAGGLGELCAAALVSRRVHTRFLSIAVPNGLYPCASRDALLRHFRLDRSSIARAIVKLVARTPRTL